MILLFLLERTELKLVCLSFALTRYHSKFETAKVRQLFGWCKFWWLFFKKKLTSFASCSFCFRTESGCKGTTFILNCLILAKLFSKFFWVLFFANIVLLAVGSLPKRVQRYDLYFELPNFDETFCKVFLSSFFANIVLLAVWFVA